MERGGGGGVVGLYARGDVADRALGDGNGPAEAGGKWEGEEKADERGAGVTCDFDILGWPSMEAPGVLAFVASVARIPPPSAVRSCPLVPPIASAFTASNCGVGHVPMIPPPSISRLLPSSPDLHLVALCPPASPRRLHRLLLGLPRRLLNRRHCWQRRRRVG